MSDMLFVAVSHSLSLHIFSLDDRCKQMSDDERALIKEKLDPTARYVRDFSVCDTPTKEKKSLLYEFPNPLN